MHIVTLHRLHYKQRSGHKSFVEITPSVRSLNPWDILLGAWFGPYIVRPYSLRAPRYLRCTCRAVFNNVALRGILLVNSGRNRPVKRHGISVNLGRRINMWWLNKASVFICANSERELHGIGRQLSVVDANSNKALT